MPAPRSWATLRRWPSGDYAAGPSHVLPTGGTARWASGLSANDFLRAGSVIQFDEAALREIAADVQRMADKEGLTAHRASVDVRTDSWLMERRTPLARQPRQRLAIGLCKKKPEP